MVPPVFQETMVTHADVSLVTMEGTANMVRILTIVQRVKHSEKNGRNEIPIFIET